MTDSTAGDKAPHTSDQPSGRPGGRRQEGEPSVPRIRVSSVAGFLSVIPHLLGFHPSRSMVVVGLDAPRGRIKLGFRYDLPDPPDPAAARDIAAHAVEVLRQRQVSTAIAAGFGEGALVTPVADALRAAARGASVTLRDVLRVENGRYWSYTCTDPLCCPPDGVPFDGPTHPDAVAMAAAGMTARPDREALAASVAPVTGPDADAMRQATDRALARLQELTATLPAPQRQRAVGEAGRAAVREAIACYRSGGRISDDDQMAWLTVTLANLPVRDDAWARMETEHREAHLRLWVDVVRRAPDHYVPAPASLLAFTAWQAGDGALANIAVERALAASPDYSMAHLIGQALEAGLPPSAAKLPMTPEEVEASYAATERLPAARKPGTRQPAARKPGARKPLARDAAPAGSGATRGPGGKGPGGKGSAGKGSAGKGSAGAVPSGGSTAARRKTPGTASSGPGRTAAALTRAAAAKPASPGYAGRGSATRLPSRRPSA